MSYQNLNQATRPFTFTIHLCDDAVQDINTEAKYFIDVGMETGYWKVMAEGEALKRVAFLTLD